MGAAREGKDIFRKLASRYPGGQWQGWDVFTRRFWRYREYIWHDTIGRHWNRLVVCRFGGHGHVQNVADPGEPKQEYCFKCQTYL